MTTLKKFPGVFVLALACAAMAGTHNHLPSAFGEGPVTARDDTRHRLSDAGLSAEQGLTIEELESMKGELISDYLFSSKIRDASGETVIPAQGLCEGNLPPELMEFIPERLRPLPAQRGVPNREEKLFFALAAKEYAGLIAYLDSQGASFDRIFRELCLHTVSSDSLFTNINPGFKIRAMFMSLYKWTKNGGKPEFQKRKDLALHFIYGGMIESYLSGLGYIAAYEKEKRDAHKPGNSFDLDDMGATMLGARWACLAGRSFWGGTRWIKPWASGERTLDKSIPKLRFGRLAHGQIAGRTQVKAVKQFVKSAISADSSSPKNRDSHLFFKKTRMK